MLTLLPGAKNWTGLVSLPNKLRDARASIIGGRLLVTGGRDGGSSKFEVTIENVKQIWLGTKSAKGLTLVQALRNRVGAKGYWRHF